MFKIVKSVIHSLNDQRLQTIIALLGLAIAIVAVMIQIYK